MDETAANGCCFTCLSKDRNLSEYYFESDVYILISSILEDVDFKCLNVLYLCWECEARVKNVQKFSSKAKTALELILSAIEKPKALDCLSTLGTTGFVYNIPSATQKSENRDEIIPTEDLPVVRKSLRQALKRKFRAESPVVPVQNDVAQTVPPTNDFLEQEVKPEKDEFYASDPDFTADCSDDSDEPLETLSKKPKPNTKKTHTKSTTYVVGETELVQFKERARKNKDFLGADVKCVECVMTFESDADLEAHTKAFHLQGHASVKCEVCNCYVPKSESETHHKTHLKIYSCNACARECCKNSSEHFQHHIDGFFTNEKDLLKHCEKEQTGVKKRRKITLAHRKNNIGPKKERINNPRKYWDSFYSIKLSDEDMMLARKRERERSPFVKKKYRCEMCLMTYSNIILYDKHIGTYHTKRPNTSLCGICNRYIKNKQFPAHVDEHHNLYICKVCEKSCCAKHNCRQYTAECAASFAHRYWICQHCKADHNETYTCEVCGKTMTQKTHYNVHREKHNTVECPVCKKEIKGSYALQHHMRHCHKEWKSEDTYCAECDKHFKNVYTYRCHLKYSKNHITLGDRRYECPECGKKYLNSYCLKDHRNREHLKIPQYTCERCDQKFLAKKHLERHIKKAHTNFKPPRDKMCSVCNKGFTTNQSLKKHMYTHTGERPYKCKLCTATFTQDASLSTHHKLVHLRMKRNIKGNKVLWEPKQPSSAW